MHITLLLALLYSLLLQHVQFQAYNDKYLGLVSQVVEIEICNTMVYPRI
jgi:hypothetical protein